ncbi:hypothetical protein K431DRAFT_283143 [Polychaeton citri CBS 116435]|uniref:Protein transport protein BOS1 n=1 Tax=Polychaeton citri CBS 116435 TaxID=1314669 RepID=A0A9P4QBG4_9PEZI|nr:hypothetical protein K431DRAFT_283143 [Polychaeton citri CBS 116435]
MSALYNSALRQSKAIRADLDAFASNSSANPTALQGQLATSLTSFSRTLDDFTRAIDVELIPEKKDIGNERLTKFRQDLLEFRSSFAELKHEREQATMAENRNELFSGASRRAGGGAVSSSTPENPYADANVARASGSGAAAMGANVNPLFRTSNPSFQPGAHGVNSYSAYQSPYGSDDMASKESHALRENTFFNTANATLDEYLERGRAVLGDLGDQREMLKGTQKKLYSVGNTLGISGDTIRMVERRAKQDKWIFWGCVAVFIVFVYFVLRWLG